MEVGQIEHDIIAEVFGILHGAEHRIGAAAEHDIEGAEVRMALVSPREKDDDHGRDNFDQKHGGYEPKGDAGSAGHDEDPTERR
jgi:hypothetical protein